MLSSRLYWKIFGTYAALSLFAAFAFIAIQTGQQREIVVDQVQQRLHDSAIVLRSYMADAFEKGMSDNLQKTLNQLGQQSETRMTLIAEDGTVIGDSAEDPAVMDNHRNREELLLARARKNGIGVSQRQSDTHGIPMMYFALRVEKNGKTVGFVRVSMAMESVNQQVSSVQRLIWVTALTISLASLAITYFVVGRIIRPLLTLTTAAENIAIGDVHQQVEVSSRDELGTLANAFNLMSRELERRIVQLQQTSSELASNSERLETVLGAMVEGVIAVDANQRVLFANNAAKTLLDISTPEIVGRPIWETVRSPKIQSVVQSNLESKEQRRVELEISRSQTVVAILASRLPGEPCPGVVLVFHDVTDLRRLERIRRDFVSNVSHELKTPLTSIRAYAETLLSGAINDTEHNRKFLEGIENQADRLHTLILDLLQLSRIESGADVFEFTIVEIEEIVQSCIAHRAAICETKKIELTSNPPATSLSMKADAEGLQTILNNLIDNAINYTPEGGQVNLRWFESDGSIVIAVQDSGIGIPEKHQSRIFERFYRVDKARSRELGGTGLGLSIVKHLVQTFHGEVELQSEVGKGSIFSLIFPKDSTH